MQTQKKRMHNLTCTCGGNMRRINKINAACTDVNSSQYLITNYATCNDCGRGAKVETTVKFITDPLQQIDLFA
jgi:hypothetical protein